MISQKELEALQSQLLAEAQADFDRQILEDLYNAKEAAHQHDLIIGAINEHLSSKGIDPSTVELHFSDYKLTYDGGSVIVEEQETPITNILREK
jgi:hypothetical protein